MSERQVKWLANGFIDIFNLDMKVMLKLSGICPVYNLKNTNMC